MDEKTQQLIESLASKLGTTAEHLWEVLIRQAPIHAASDAVCDILFVVGVVWAYKKVIGFKWGDEQDSIERLLVYGVFAIVALVIACIIATDIPLILAGFFNPEYWALKQILK